MKNFRVMVMLCALVLGLMVVPAQAEKNGVYAGVKFIDSIQTLWGEDESRTRNSIGGGIFLGYDFKPQFDFPIRAEIEYALRSNTHISESNTYYRNGIQSLLANFYFDFHNESAFTPYVGAGLGLAFVNHMWDGGGLDLTVNSTNFAWQVGAGVAYAFNDMVSADLGYRFISFGTSVVDERLLDTSIYNAAHEFSLGVRFKF